jgi:predicted nucleotidyltransferase
MLCAMEINTYFGKVKTAYQIQQELVKLKPILMKRFYVSSIGLFGSYVRNEQSEESDLDIIVDFSQPVGMEFIDLADFLETELNTKIDLVSLKGVKPKYLETIKSEILYV